MQERQREKGATPVADRRSHLVFIVDGLERGVIERSLKTFMDVE